MNRSIQVEGAFGVINEDYGFRRFLTRGKRETETQFFLLAFAYNIRKLCNRLEIGRFGVALFDVDAAWLDENMLVGTQKDGFCSTLGFVCFFYLDCFHGILATDLYLAVTNKTSMSGHTGSELL